MTKMTYAQAIDFAVEMIYNGEADFNGFTVPDYVEKLEALKVQLAKRNGGKKGLTKTQKENEVIKEVILNVLADHAERMTVSDMIADERLNGYTNQKISALLRQLVDKEMVEKTMEKRKAYFIIVG